MSDKQTILFILSSGHSGSTVLDLCLGNHPACASLGEVCHLQEVVDSDKAVCVCGQMLAQCTFWNATKDKLYKNYGLNINKGGGFILRPEYEGKRSLSSKIVLLMKLVGLKKVDEKWLNNMDSLCQALFSVSNAQILVDSSKDIIRALMMRKKNKDYHVKFLHLVRDVRGVSYSYNKKSFTLKLPGEEKKEINRDNDIYSIAEASKLWFRYNTRVSTLLKLLVPEQDIMRIKYEDLCSKPDETLSNISNWLELDNDFNLTEFVSGKHHNIGGNPSRFNSSGLKSADEKWREALSEEQQKSCLQIAGKLSHKYGYS